MSPVALLVHFLFHREREKEREREREIHSPYIMPNLPKENKSYKHQIIELKKEKRKEDLLKLLWQYVYSTYVVQFN